MPTLEELKKELKLEENEEITEETVLETSNNMEELPDD